MSEVTKKYRHPSSTNGQRPQQPPPHTGPRIGGARNFVTRTAAVPAALVSAVTVAAVVSSSRGAFEQDNMAAAVIVAQVVLALSIPKNGWELFYSQYRRELGRVTRLHVRFEESNWPPWQLRHICPLNVADGCDL